MEFVRCMGWLWLERNIGEFLSHVLGLVSNPRACPTHVDAVYARKCVNFILRSVIGGILSEKAQLTAAKEICQVIIRQMNALGKFLSISEMKAIYLKLSKLFCVQMEPYSLLIADDFAFKRYVDTVSLLKVFYIQF